MKSTIARQIYNELSPLFHQQILNKYKMFSKKQQPDAIASTSAKQPFIKQGLKTAATTTSGNGATKYSETDNAFVTQFGSVGNYRQQRSFEDISRDMSTLWAINPRLAICFVLFIRMITRVVSLFDGKKTETVQRGAGLKHESIMRMIWLGVYHPDSFAKNLHLFVSVGSWKDIIQMMSYDIQYNGFEKKVLNWDFLSNFIIAGIQNPNTKELVLKYLPHIRAKLSCKTIEAQANSAVAKYLCFKLFPGRTGFKSYAEYRKLKSSGTAHTWQQLISKKLFEQIDFNTVHGRALAQMVGSKFLDNHGLTTKYAAWIAQKPVAKFTGFVYELGIAVNKAIAKHQYDTINAQFNQLLEKAGKSNNNFIVVRDTSGSMDSSVIGLPSVRSSVIAKSIAIMLAKMLNGRFANHWIDFNSNAILQQLRGSNFTEWWKNDSMIPSANTNFLSVADLFCKIKREGVNEGDFPNGIVCISDGEFDNVGMYKTTNIQSFKQRMIEAGFSTNFVNNFTFVFWDIRNSFYHKFANTKFETYDTKQQNVFYYGGFDPSVITFLTGVEGTVGEKQPPKTALDLFNAAMDQEILNMVEV